MATTAKKGYGAVVEYSDGASPPVWTALSEVTAVSPLAQPRAELNVTNMDSPNEAEEFIAALKTGTNATISVNNTYHASQTTLSTRALAGETVDFRIRYTQYSPVKTVSFSLAMLDAAIQETTPGAAIILQYSGRFTGGIVTT